MADVPLRITELPELANPTVGNYIVTDDGVTTSKMNMENMIPSIEDYISIGTWNMRTNNKKEITGIANVSEIIRIAGIVIYDDDGNIYDGSALYDEKFHENLYTTGSGINTISDPTESAYGSETKVLLICDCTPPSGVSKRHGTLSAPTLTVGGTGNYIVSHGYGSTAYDVFPYCTNSGSWGTGVVRVIKSANSFQVILADDESTFDGDFSFKMEAFTPWASHSHDLDISKNIVVTSGYEGRALQVIPKLVVGSSKIILIHNFLGLQTSVDSGGMGTATYSDIGQFNLFRTAANRGYVVVKRNYKT